MTSRSWIACAVALLPLACGTAPEPAPASSGAAPEASGAVEPSESPDSAPVPSANREYVEKLVRGRVPDPTACASDADCVVSNVDDAACGCCTCKPVYAIAQRAAEDWVMAAVTASCEQQGDWARGEDGQWTQTSCADVRCAPVLGDGSCGGDAAMPASRAAVCRSGHCELPGG